MFELIFKKRNLLYKNIYRKTILKIIYVQDYIQIYFNDNGILNLYNKTIINGDKTLYINKIVNNVILTKKKLKIYCNKNLFIEMSMKNKDFLGPEAYEYNNNEIIIVGN